MWKSNRAARASDNRQTGTHTKQHSNTHRRRTVATVVRDELLDVGAPRLAELLCQREHKRNAVGA